MEWTKTNRGLTKTFKFEHFRDITTFLHVNAPMFDEVNHHPDFKVHGYRHLTFELITHDTQSITEKDFNLAEQIDQVFETFKA